MIKRMEHPVYRLAMAYARARAYRVLSGSQVGSGLDVDADRIEYSRLRAIEKIAKDELWEALEMALPKEEQ